jgi:hypothetical protein
MVTPSDPGDFALSDQAVHHGFAIPVGAKPILVPAACAEDGGIDADKFSFLYLSARPRLPGFIAASVWIKSSSAYADIRPADS